MSDPPRAALVTGGSSGIGLAIAAALAAEGYDVTVAARGAERAEAAVRSLRDAGGSGAAITADVSDAAAVAGLLAGHRERAGRLDVLVNAAGYGGPVADLDELDERRLERILDTNLRSAVLVTRAALPMLRAAGREHAGALLVNVSSYGALHGMRGAAAYSAAKAGVLRLGEALGLDLASDGVRVTTLCPSVTDTPMARAAWSGRLAQDEMLDPRDAGEVVRFLLRVSSACAVPEVALLRTGLRL